MGKSGIKEKLERNLLYILALGLFLLAVAMFFLKDVYTLQDVTLRAAAIALLTALGFAWLGLKHK